MNVNFVVEDPAGVTEALHRAKLEPLRTFCVVDLHRHCFSDSVGTTPNDDHGRAHEERGLLLARNRRVSVALLGRLDPVPAAITVSAQAPGVVECALVNVSAAENHHHAVGTARGTHASRVLHPRAGPFVASFHFGPTERSLLNVETPHVSYRFAARVASEYQQMWPSKNDGVTLSTPRCLSHHRHNHPVRDFFTLPQIQ